MNIYLDIDGVILASEAQPALHSKKFIKHIVENHDVYWLTTHCRRPGDDPMNRLAIIFDEKTAAYLDQIHPAYWEEWKTDGIDFTREFRWIDDDLFEEEKRALEKNDAQDSFIGVDLYNDPGQLREIIGVL